MEEARFACAVVAERAEVGEGFEEVVEPGEQDVVAGEAFVEGVEVEVGVDEGLDAADEVAGCAVVCGVCGEEDDFFGDEAEGGRVPLSR